MTKFCNLALALLLGFAANAALAQAPDAAAKAKEVCAACHGDDGNQSMTPDTPKLGGQPADYLTKALHDYKSGKRKNPIMGAMAGALTDDEIKGLARYFAAQKSEIYVKY
jgi:cytochrome c553